MHMILKGLIRIWKDFIITKNDTFMPELWSFVEMISRCGFFESGNVALVIAFIA